MSKPGPLGRQGGRECRKGGGRDGEGERVREVKGRLGIERWVMKGRGGGRGTGRANSGWN